MFAILSLKVSRDMKSIAAGPLRSGGKLASFPTLHLRPRPRPMGSLQGSASLSAQRQRNYRAKTKLGSILIRRQEVGYGMVVDGIAKFQPLKFGDSGPEISRKIPCFAA